jgi:hypothetical protein
MAWTIFRIQLGRDALLTFRRIDFDARDLAVVAEPDLAQAHFPQQSLTAVDLAQPFGRNLGSIGKS